MSDALTLADTQLQKAKRELEIAEEQYNNAEAVYRDAKPKYEALEVPLDTQVDNSRHRSTLCESCRAISISSTFKLQRSSIYRRKVGDLFHAIETQSSCPLCKFLIEAFQLGNETQSERLHAQLKPRDTAIFFASDLEGEAWYTKAGVNTSLSACPFVWLQTGPPTTTGQPHICISFLPTPKGAASETQPNRKAYPRKKEPLEAFNGSVNYDLVKSWIQKCSTEHGTRCNLEDTVSGLPMAIRVIDVKTRHLVRRHAGDRFIALSYVWGKGLQDDIASLIYANPSRLATRQMARDMSITLTHCHIPCRRLWKTQSVLSTEYASVSFG